MNEARIIKQREVIDSIRLLLRIICFSLLLANPTLSLEGGALCSTDGITIGYSDWTTFRNDVIELNAQPIEERNNFVLCPLTIFEIDEPLLIEAPSMLHCGADQSSIDQCILFGGTQHLIISAETTLQGLTFRGATETAVTILSASTKIKDCTFQDGTGTSVIQMEPKESDETESPQLEISESFFWNNKVTESIITSHASMMQLTSTEFRTNQGQAVVHIASGNLGIVNSYLLGML